jgi:hypothetical protein
MVSCYTLALELQKRPLEHRDGRPTVECTVHVAQNEIHGLIELCIPSAITFFVAACPFPFLHPRKENGPDKERNMNWITDA